MDRSSEPVNVRTLHHNPSSEMTRYLSRARVFEPSELMYTRSQTCTGEKERRALEVLDSRLHGGYGDVQRAVI